jgi:hypothetical protein
VAAVPAIINPPNRITGAFGNYVRANTADVDIELVPGTNGSVLVSPGTTANPAIGNKATPGAGLEWSGNTLYIVNEGTRRFEFGNNGYAVITGTYALAWGSTGVASPDLFLYRAAAGILHQRNAATGQAFRISNIYTDASNQEYLEAGWSANVAYLRMVKVGGTTARNLKILAGDNAVLTLGQQNADIWQINGGGNFVAAVDATYSIGASGATRPLHGFFSGNVTVGGDFNFAGGARLYFLDGTNAGTLKLVVKAGAGGAETTILDNIPQS